MEQPSPALLKTKTHFSVLDGLRGVAALSVVTFHFMEMAISDYSKNFIGHGFLAVDFFFCLSGFVIGYAYDDRIRDLGVLEFFKSRLIRLHPMVILGTVLGLLAFLFDPFAGHPESYSAGRMVLIFLCSMLVIPFPVMAGRAYNLFGLNAPTWSLFWEYIANIFYAVLLCRMGRRWHIILLVAAGLALCKVCYTAGNLMGGWDGHTFWHGGIRLAYSFLAGLLVYRCNWQISNKLGFGGVAVSLFAAFMMPFSRWNWLTEPAVILFYFPFIIALGAGAPALRTKKLSTFAGNISYPLYMTHYAVLWMFGNYYAKYKPDALHMALIICCSLVVLVTFAWLVMTFYDAPVRKYLAGKRRLA
jgi:peptidoglycan/LPS O-acetylase OafA/YrhL